MLTVSVEEAAHRLGQLIEDAQAGEEVILESGNVPVARIIPVAAPNKVPVRGSARDSILYMADDFDAPLEDLREYMA